MRTLERLSVVMSVFGAALVVAACASPTDAEIAEPAQQQDDPVQSDSDETAATSSSLTDKAEDEAEEAEADEAEEDDEAEEGSVSQEQRYGEPGYGQRPGYGEPGYGRGRGPARQWCSYRDAWHCRRHHPGWRWVNVQGGPPGERYGEYRRHGNRCCMRVHIRDHRPGRGY